MTCSGPFKVKIEKLRFNVVLMKLPISIWDAKNHSLLNLPNNGDSSKNSKCLHY